MRDERIPLEATHTTRTIDGRHQFCRGALERGLDTHLCTTYTSLHYGEAGAFHFCDEHPLIHPLHPAPFQAGGNMGGDCDQHGRPVVDGLYYVTDGDHTIAGPFRTEGAARRWITTHHPTEADHA